ncbi:MAG TPA: R3H domain-containing nucleic acid-binding protein [Blastocatellia bacterium]|nr:R3H domain-containing nucleic acid-binding protein [Blastocatellia bacterium]
MSEPDLSIIADFTNQLFESSGLDLTASVEQAEDGAKIEIRGDDIPLLLGHHAELLDAIEYLGNRVLARAAGEDARVVFDCGNYRARREKELRMMAEKAAEKVRASGVPFSFDPMGPNERRILHLALVDDQTVKTESRGNGPDRRVTIYPA